MESKIACAALLSSYSLRRCDPCTILTLMLEDVIAESKGKADLAKVNTDENQELTMEYWVRARMEEGRSGRRGWETVKGRRTKKGIEVEIVREGNA